MPAYHALRSTHLLCGYSGRLPKTNYSLLLAKPCFFSRSTVQSKYEAHAGLCLNRGFGRPYSSRTLTSPNPSTLPTGTKIDYYNADYNSGRLRCDVVTDTTKTYTVVRVQIQNSLMANALTPSLLRVLKTTIRDLALKDDVRCVILTGEKNFSTGMNVNSLARLDSPEEAREFIGEVYEACQAVRELPVPTIAQISGRCYGAGLELAASCDFRYATADASFAMPEVKLGIPSVIQARLLANIIGWQHTRQLLLFGNAIDIHTASKWGLVNEYFPSHEVLFENVGKIAHTIGNNAPVAIKAQKSLIRHWEENDLASGVAAGIESFAGAFENGGAEPKEYFKRFFQNRRTIKDASKA